MSEQLSGRELDLHEGLLGYINFEADVSTLMELTGWSKEWATNRVSDWWEQHREGTDDD